MQVSGDTHNMDHLNKSQKGELAELRMASEFKRLGGDVFFPVGASKIDAMVYIGGSVYKVQVKTASTRKSEVNAVRATLSSSAGFDYHNVVDAFVVYNPKSDECYWLYTHEVGDTTASICTVGPDEVHPPNRERATFAEDVVIRERFDSQN
jgi:hypothetical protein